MASLALTFADLYTAVSEFLGLGSTPTGTNLAKVKAIVNRAYRQFLYPVDVRNGKVHTWSWLKASTTLTTAANTYIYALPADFGYLLSALYYGDSKGFYPLRKVSAERIWQNRTESISQAPPAEFAIVPTTTSHTTGTTWSLWLDPVPDGVYTYRYRYVIQPAKLETGTDYPLGGIAVVEPLLEMCLAIAEQQDDDMQSTHHTELANDMLQKLVMADVVDAPNSVGFLGSGYGGLAERLAELRTIRSAVSLSNVYA